MKILLVAYDNESKLPTFPSGLGYIASILLKNDHEVEIYNQDTEHYPDSHLTKYLDENKFDVLGLSFIGGYYQYRKAVSLSDAINKSRNRPFYIIGGHGPSPEPEYFLKKTHADVVVIGEGEETIIDLLNSISHKQDLINVDGIAFRDKDKIVINKRRKLIKNLDLIPFPSYHLFPINVYRLRSYPNSKNEDFTMPMLSGRGCNFSCNFCYRIDGVGSRQRSVESIIEEINLLKKDYGINYIVFFDELLMSSEDRIVKICECMIKENLNIKWNCQGRLNYAKLDVLKLMKRAGCVFINYGIECFDDQILKNMNKALNTRQIVEGIESTLRVGLNPGLNLIFGNIGENKETLMKSVDFLLKYDDGTQLRTIRPVTPYPGCPLYYYAINKGLLKDVEDFYENKHLNSDLISVNFTELTDKEYYDCLWEANTILLKNYYKRLLLSSLSSCKNLYLDRNALFRGFRHQ